MKTNTANVPASLASSEVLACLSTLRDCLEESHAGEHQSDHFGDGPAGCSYCAAIARADALLAASSPGVAPSPVPDAGLVFPALLLVHDGAEVVSVDLVHDAGDLDWRRRKASDAAADAFSVSVVPLSLVLVAPALRDALNGLQSAPNDARAHGVALAALKLAGVRCDVG